MQRRTTFKTSSWTLHPGVMQFWNIPRSALFFDDRDEGDPRKLILVEATGVVVWTSARDDDHDHHHERN